MQRHDKPYLMQDQVLDKSFVKGCEVTRFVLFLELSMVDRLTAVAML